MIGHMSSDLCQQLCWWLARENPATISRQPVVAVVVVVVVVVVGVVAVEAVVVAIRSNTNQRR